MKNKINREEFTDDQIKAAIKSFLDYGEETYDPNKGTEIVGKHRGYFSGNGWAARCLRYHLQKIS